MSQKQNVYPLKRNAYIMHFCTAKDKARGWGDKFLPLTAANFQAALKVAAHFISPEHIICVFSMEKNTPSADSYFGKPFNIHTGGVSW